MIAELTYDKARKKFKVNTLDCSTTAELEPLQQIIGQDRAVKALQFGLKMKDGGFNIYVSGQSGTGRKTAIVSFLQEKAKDMPIPPDWCYVNNFKDPNQPNALKLPAGKGKSFRDDMDKFTDEVKKELQKAFESEDYAQKRTSTVKKFDEDKAKLWQEINKKANEAGFVLQRSPVGIAIIPVINGQPIADEQFTALPPKDQGADKDPSRDATGRLQERLPPVPRPRQERRGSHREVQQGGRHLRDGPPPRSPPREVWRHRGGQGFPRQRKGRHTRKPPTILTAGQPQQQPALPFLMPSVSADPTNSYKVNLLVDNSELKGAPVITEMSPTQPHLFGIVQKEARFGALITDYTMIRGGSAHKANGGFLVIPVEDLSWTRSLGTA